MNKLFTILLLAIVTIICCSPVFSTKIIFDNENFQNLYSIQNVMSVTSNTFYGQLDASYIQNAPWITSCSASSMWNITGSNYIINQSGVLNINESKSNNTCKVIASQFNETSTIISVNDSCNSKSDAINASIVKYTHLTNFTDNLGDRGYNDLKNFSNSPGYITNNSMNKTVNYANIVGVPNFITNNSMNKTVDYSNIVNLPNFITNDTMNKTVNYDNVINVPDFALRTSLEGNISLLNKTLSALNDNMSALNTSLIKSILDNISKLNSDLGISIDENASVINEKLFDISSTGLIDGGILSIDPTNTSRFNLSAGIGVIVNNYANPLSPTYQYVVWEDKSGIVSELIDSTDTTYIFVDTNGNIVQSADYPTPEMNTENILIGWTDQVDRRTLDFALTEPHYPLNTYSQVATFLDAFGSFNVDGGNDYQSADNLKLQKTAGYTFEIGSNYVNSKENPNILTSDNISIVDFTYYYRNDVGDWINNNSISNDIDPNYYDNNSGTLTEVPEGNWTIQLIQFYAPMDVTDIQYGQELYDSLEEAEANINAPIEVDPYNYYDTKRAYLIVKSGANNLSNTSQAMFIKIGSFGQTATSSAVGGTSSGEVNTASNIGTLGTGLYFTKLGVDLQFKNIRAFSNKITLYDNVTTHSVDLDIDDSQLNVNKSNYLDGPILNAPAATDVAGGYIPYYFNGTHSLAARTLYYLNGDNYTVLLNLANTKLNNDNYTDLKNNIEGRGNWSLDKSSYATTSSVSTSISGNKTETNAAISANASGKVNITGNWVNSAYNATFDNVFAKISYTYIQNPPWISSYSEYDPNWAADKPNYATTSSLSAYTTNTAFDTAMSANKTEVTGAMTANVSTKVAPGSIECTSNQYMYNFTLTTTGTYTSKCSAVTATVTYQDSAAGFTNTTVDTNTTKQLNVKNSNSSFIANFIGNTPSYAEIGIMNLNNTDNNTGENASADWYAYANASDKSNYYVGCGINGFYFNRSKTNWLSFSNAKDSYCYAQNSSFAVGTTTGGYNYSIFTNSTERVRFNENNVQFSQNSIISINSTKIFQTTNGDTWINFSANNFILTDNSDPILNITQNDVVQSQYAVKSGYIFESNTVKRESIFKDMELNLASYNRVTTAPTIDTIDTQCPTCLNFPTAATAAGDGGYIMNQESATNNGHVNASKLYEFRIRTKFAAATNCLNQSTMIGVFKTGTNVDMTTAMTGIFWYYNMTIVNATMSNITNTVRGNWSIMTCNAGVCDIKVTPLKCDNNTAADNGWHDFGFIGNNINSIQTNYTFYYTNYSNQTVYTNYMDNSSRIAAMPLVSMIGTYTELKYAGTAETTVVDFSYYDLINRWN